MLCQNEDESNILNHIVENTGFTKQFLLVSLCHAFIVMAEAFILCTISLSVPVLERKWDLSPQSVSVLESAFLNAYLIFSLISGPIADGIGRKKTVILGSSIGIVSSAAFAALAHHSYLAYCLLYFSCGIAIGLTINPTITLISEVANSELRAYAINWAWVLFPLGEISSVVLAKTLKIYVFESEQCATLNTSITGIVWI